MKLTELIEPPFRINLKEVFDTKIEPDSWTTDQEGNRIGLITIDGKQFQIMLQRGEYEDLQYINIAFRVWSEIHNGWFEQVTFDNKQAAKIIGAIVHAVQDELQKLHYDALIFAASDNVDQRMRIYNWIATKYSKDFGCIKQNIKMKDGKLCTIICTKEFCNHQSIDDVVEEINLRVK